MGACCPIREPPGEWAWGEKIDDRPGLNLASPTVVDGSDLDRHDRYSDEESNAIWMRSG